MPVRALAFSPGEFMRKHLVAAGGMDYPQSIYKAYKMHLKSVGLKDGCSRSSWSRYIWLANRLDLIEFDHAEAPSYWDGIVDGVEVLRTYQREPRPQAPSPRHYYRIVDPNDPRWSRLEASYRASMGFEVPSPAPKPVPKPPKEKKVPPPAPKPPKPKLKKKPRVEKPKPPTAEAKVQPYEDRMVSIIASLSELETAPSVEAVADIDNRLLELGEDILESAEKAKGKEKTLLSTLSLRWRTGIEEIPLLRSSVQRYLVSRTPSEKQRAAAALRAAIRVLEENMSPGKAE